MTDLDRLVEGELTNGRLAMLAVPGTLLPEFLGKGPWFEAAFKVCQPPPSSSLFCSCFLLRHATLFNSNCSAVSLVQVHACPGVAWKE